MTTQIVHIQTINVSDARAAALAFAAAGSAFGGIAPRALGENIEAAGPQIIDMPMLAEAANAASLLEAQQENAGDSGYWPAPSEIVIEHQEYSESTNSWTAAEPSKAARIVLRYGLGRSRVMWIMRPDFYLGDGVCGEHHSLVFGVRAESVDSDRVGIATVDEWDSALASVQQRIDAARRTWEPEPVEPMAGPSHPPTVEVV